MRVSLGLFIFWCIALTALVAWLGPLGTAYALAYIFLGVIGVSMLL